ncbi:DUF4013 domain-containing protein [Nanoarchaeota archaeon]
MAEFWDTIKRPFTSFKNLTIGALLFTIPLLGIAATFFDIPLLVTIIGFTVFFLGLIAKLFAYGYSLNAALAQNKKTLPRWTNWKKLFIKGFLMMIIALIYFIPLFIIMLVFGTVAFVTSLNTGDITTAVASASIGVLVSFFIIIITAYITPVAIFMYGKKERFNDAFHLRRVFKKAFTKQWFLAWLLAVVFSLIIGYIGGFIAALLGYTVGGAFLIIGYTQFIVLIISLTFLGRAFEKIK